MSANVNDPISYNDLRDIPTIQTLSGTNYTFRKIGKVVQLTLNGCTSIPSVIPDGFFPLEDGWQSVINQNDVNNIYFLYIIHVGKFMLLLKGNDVSTVSYKLYGTFTWMTA